MLTQARFCFMPVLVFRGDIIILIYNIQQKNKYFVT